MSVSFSYSSCSTFPITRFYYRLLVDTLCSIHPLFFTTTCFYTCVQDKHHHHHHHHQNGSNLWTNPPPSPPPPPTFALHPTLLYRLRRHLSHRQLCSKKCPICFQQSTTITTASKQCPLFGASPRRAGATGKQPEPETVVLQPFPQREQGPPAPLRKGGKVLLVEEAPPATWGGRGARPIGRHKDVHLHDRRAAVPRLARRPAKGQSHSVPQLTAELFAETLEWDQVKRKKSAWQEKNVSLDPRVLLLMPSSSSNLFFSPICNLLSSPIRHSSKRRSEHSYTPDFPGWSFSWFSPFLFFLTSHSFTSFYILPFFYFFPIS